MCNDQSFVEASTSISSPSSISMISAESYDSSDMNDFLFFSSNSSCDSDIGNGLNALSTTQHQSGLPTYKLVGDNIDKNIRPRDVRINSQTVSLHYYHSYALRDRIDLTSLEDSPSLPDMEGIRLENFLPTLQDEETIKGNFQHLIARVLIRDVKYFEKYWKNCIDKHIDHEYSHEMSQRSEVVSQLLLFFKEILYYFN